MHVLHGRDRTCCPSLVRVPLRRMQGWDGLLGSHMYRSTEEPLELLFFCGTSRMRVRHTRYVSVIIVRITACQSDLHNCILVFD